MRGMRREVVPQRRIEDLPDWALTPAQLNQRYKRMPVHDPFGTHPGEAEILTEILTLHRQQMPAWRIAHRLNERKVRARGKRWYETSVRRIIERVGTPPCP
jgi:hypothetical protein